MDRSSIIRTLLIIGASILFFKFALPKITGKSDVPSGRPLRALRQRPGLRARRGGRARPAARPRRPRGSCAPSRGSRFDAQLSSRGTGLEHLWIRDPQYAAGSTGLDISTTPDHERWRNLRTLFRDLPVTGDVALAGAPDDQVKFDRFNWKVESLGGTGCKFTYADDTVSIVKTITTTERPFELSVSTTIKNLATSAKKHRFSIQEFAYRANHEVKGHLGRVSPFQTDLQCARTGDVVRKNKDDFKTGWYTQPLSNRYAAIANTFFAQALVPVLAKGSVAPECEILAEQWFAAGQSKDDDNAGDIYHATLEYPSRELQPNESATYQDIAFFGPKEREILSKVDGGAPHLNDLINLGFFSPVGARPGRHPRLLPRPHHLRELGTGHRRDDHLPQAGPLPPVDPADPDDDRHAAAQAGDRRGEQEVRPRRPGQADGHHGDLPAEQGEPPSAAASRSWCRCRCGLPCTPPCKPL